MPKHPDTITLSPHSLLDQGLLNSSASRNECKGRGREVARARATLLQWKRLSSSSMQLMNNG
eukprot:8418050-Pyramimonas_sp.AAC.1